MQVGDGPCWGRPLTFRPSASRGHPESSELVLSLSLALRDVVPSGAEGPVLSELGGAVLRKAEGPKECNKWVVT